MKENIYELFIGFSENFLLSLESYPNNKQKTTNFAMNKELIMNPNQLVAFLEKPCAEFTKEDIKRSIPQNGIRMVNFM